MPSRSTILLKALSQADLNASQKCFAVPGLMCWMKPSAGIRNATPYGRLNQLNLFFSKKLAWFRGIDLHRSFQLLAISTNSPECPRFCHLGLVSYLA